MKRPSSTRNTIPSLPPTAGALPDRTAPLRNADLVSIGIQADAGRPGDKLNLKTLGFIVGLTVLAPSLSAIEYHVNPKGSDQNPGTLIAPLRTIQAAAECAQPGDVITVHAGIYRERISPPRGGTSADRRIVYQGAPGEQVEVSGAEVITNWVALPAGVWKVVIPNAYFGAFNPYANLIHGDWFEARDRAHHTGAVYLNGDWLTEASRREEVLKPDSATPLWFGEVDAERTTIWAQFKDVNPNLQRVEINVRRTVFYPAKPGINYLTVRGFTLRQAATPWAPPTAEQVGLIGTHWSRGWLIENNVIHHSVCAGLALGKYGDEWDNTSANTAEGYVKTIERARQNGWQPATIGHHVVRSNTISHCEQAGIVGSLGATFSTIAGNKIHDIHVRRLFSGAEMAGIKLHGAIDVTISGNQVSRSCRGLWLDWMAQGTRVSGNLFHDNASEDLFVEVNHGPFLVDNNVFLSAVSVLDVSEGGAYVHNLFAGRLRRQPEPNRATPFHPAHTTTVAGLTNTLGGDNRFYNNIFIGKSEPDHGRANAATQSPPPAKGFGLSVYDGCKRPLQTGGNRYYNGAQPYSQETGTATEANSDATVEFVEAHDGSMLELKLSPTPKPADAGLVTTARLGFAAVPNLPYENADGSPIKIATDFLGRPRPEARPTPGPFENLAAGPTTLQIWKNK